MWRKSVPLHQSPLLKRYSPRSGRTVITVRNPFGTVFKVFTVKSKVHRKFRVRIVRIVRIVTKCNRKPKPSQWFSRFSSWLSKRLPLMVFTVKTFENRGFRIRENLWNSQRITERPQRKTFQNHHVLFIAQYCTLLHFYTLYPYFIHVSGISILCLFQSFITCVFV